MSTVLIEGKTKVIIDAGDGTVLVISKDDITAGDGAKHDTLEGKAICSTQTTCNVFELLEANGVKTHYVGRVNDTTFRARNVQMIPLELVVRRIATGSYLKRDPGVADGTVFDDLVFEVYEKDDANHDPMLEFGFWFSEFFRFTASVPRNQGFMNSEKIADSAFPYLTPQMLSQLREISFIVFEILEAAWEKHNGVLYDFKIECGIDASTGELLVADVIDSDSWRLRFDGVQVDKQSYRDGSKSLPDIRKDFQQVAALTDQFV